MEQQLLRTIVSLRVVHQGNHKEITLVNYYHNYTMVAFFACLLIDLIHDTHHLCTRVRTDGLM